MKYPFVYNAAALAALLGFAISSARAAPAPVVFDVNTVADLVDSSLADPACHTVANTCSLRAAVMQANTSFADVIINLPAGTYPLTIQGTNTDGADSGDLNITSSPSSATSEVRLVGAGVGRTIIDSRTGFDGVISVDQGRRVKISGVTIRNGKPARGFGGGVFSQGILTISDSAIESSFSTNVGGGILIDGGTLELVRSVVRLNSTNGLGGGIYASGAKVTISDSIIESNHAEDLGGGIVSDTGNMLEVSGSTIRWNITGGRGGGMYVSGGGGVNAVRSSTLYGNGANFGGAIENSGLIYVVNSTLSGNYSYVDGGGIDNGASSAAAFLYNTSIIDNDANDNRSPDGGSGGGIMAIAGSRLVLVNSLVARNTQLADVNNPDDCAGTVEVYGWNLLGNLYGCTFLGNGPPGRGSVSPNTIGPLQNNGGPTLTHALLAGSEAINSTKTQGCIDETGKPLTTDQRDAPRIAGVRCDVGAFEYGAVIDFIFRNGFE